DFQAGHRDGPIFEALPFAGIGAAYMGLIGTLAALYRRHEDGWGRHVQTSLLDGLLAYMSILWWDCDAIPAVNRRRTGGSDGTRIVARTFLCSDGTYVGIHTGAVGAFGRLMSLLGLDDRIPPGQGRDMGTPLSADQARIIV